MPPKARQHIIPRVFLNAFCESEPPPDHPPGREYSGALWVIPTSLTGAPWRRAPRKVFRELNAHALKDDDPRRPVIEERLAVLESAYARVSAKMKGHETLTLEDCEIVALFVATLYLRTPSQMAHWQGQLDKLQEVYRQVDRGANGSVACDGRQRCRGPCRSG